MNLRKKVLTASFLVCILVVSSVLSPVVADSAIERLRETSKAFTAVVAAAVSNIRLRFHQFPDSLTH